MDGALLERDLKAGPHSSSVLDARWVVAPADDHAIALRITAGRDSESLVPTRMEARQAEAQARQAAEDRVHELEAELQRRG